jgi:hypothetical protein
MNTCGKIHYPGNDPENGPAEPCALSPGHDGFHVGLSQLTEPEPDPECRCQRAKSVSEFASAVEDHCIRPATPGRRYVQGFCPVCGMDVMFECSTEEAQELLGIKSNDVAADRQELVAKVVYDLRTLADFIEVNFD